jgi:hypothetical protein
MTTDVRTTGVATAGLSGTALEPNTRQFSEADKLKVTVLLKEYDTLRQEIVGRINNRFGIVSLGSALGVFLVSQQPTRGRVALIGVWAVLILVLWWRTGLLILRCSKRIAEIERAVNLLVGDELLVWETRGGRSWMRLYGRQHD